MRNPDRRKGTLLKTQDITVKTHHRTRTRYTAPVKIPPISELRNHHKVKLETEKLLHTMRPSVNGGKTRSNFRIYIHPGRRCGDMLPADGHFQCYLFFLSRYLVVARNLEEGPKNYFFWSRLASKQAHPPPSPPPLLPSPPLLSVRTTRCKNHHPKIKRKRLLDRCSRLFSRDLTETISIRL